MQHTDDEVLRERRGALGALVLNRPHALNALTHAMVLRIDAALQEWEQDAAVETVLISGAGERGLCAGGDIVSIYRDAHAGGENARSFWRDEYRLNARIARYPKPLVAFMDGIVLGGGVGVSAHASQRIVTERTRVGMPEVGIGFSPDVGGSYLLSRAPGQLGTHLAMTGSTVTGADAVALGMADHQVHSDWLPTLATALESTPAAEAIRAVAGPAADSPLAAERHWIDACYTGEDAGAIVARLQASPVDEAREAADTILTKSPTGVSVALAAIRRAGQAASLEEVLDQDYRVSAAFLDSHDLIEGIRAQMIDKDRNPKWSPASLAEVADADVAAFFADRGDDELGLSDRKQRSAP